MRPYVRFRCSFLLKRDGLGAKLATDNRGLIKNSLRCLPSVKRVAKLAPYSDRRPSRQSDKPVSMIISGPVNSKLNRPRKGFAVQRSVWTIACYALLICLACGSAGRADCQENAETGVDPVLAAGDLLDVSLLKQIEDRVLPPRLELGSARLPDLPAYYWAENQELRTRFELARHKYESSSRPFRRLTLIAGSAGVGKTFIKRDIFSKDYPAEEICKFDVKELYQEWKAKGLVEDRPDLYCGEVVLSRLPAINPGRPQLMRQFLEAQSACFFVIDSLDEVHPDDYEALLKQIEQFVLQSDRPFLHVVVLGRSLAFRDYWRSRSVSPSREQIALFLLRPPRFLTTGDLMISSWNYHTWRYQLRWQLSTGLKQTMPFDAYAKWVKSGFPDSVLTRRVLYQSNQNMNPLVQSTVESWARESRVVVSMLYNLAGNSMIREIAESFAYEQRPYDERAVMEAYLAKWLERDTKSENRPSSAKPEHLELYMRLVQGVAAKYSQESQVDTNGFFTVDDDDHIEVMYEGQRMRFPVLRILNRSGLKYLDPRKPGVTSYRFEPVWFHRLLVEKHNDMIDQVIDP